MRILVTGASGFAGRHLCARLVHAGHEVHGWGLAHTGPPGVSFAAVDLADRDQVERALEVIKPERVFHLGAIVDTVHTPDEVRLYRVNAMGTVHLLDGLRGLGLKATRVLVASSAFVYGAVPEAQNPVPETRPALPQTPYAASKVAAESAALVASRFHGLHVVVARAFNHTGPGHASQYSCSGWARAIAEASLAQRSLALKVGNLAVRRDYLDVRDCVSAYEALLEHGRPAEIYNVGRGEAVALSELLRLLISNSEVPVSVEVDPARLRVSDAPLLLADLTKLHRDAPAFEPEYPLARTMADLVAYWKEELGPRLTNTPV